MAGGYRPQPQGIAAIVAKFRESEKVQADLRKMITGFGLTVDPQGNLIFDATGKNIIIKNGSGLDIQDDGNANVDGSLTVGGTETVGGTLHVTGNTIIDGTLSLPNGSVNNSALTNPSAFDVNWADLNSTNLTVAGAYLASMSIPVPAGFTRAQVVCNGTVGNTRNVSAGGAPFYVAAIIGATAAATIATTCPDGGSASLTSMWVANLTGLTPGGSISASVWAAVDSTSGWTAGTANAHTVAYATFLR